MWSSLYTHSLYTRNVLCCRVWFSTLTTSMTDGSWWHVSPELWWGLHCEGMPWWLADISQTTWAEKSQCVILAPQSSSNINLFGREYLRFQVGPSCRFLQENVTAKKHVITVIIFTCQVAENKRVHLLDAVCFHEQHCKFFTLVQPSMAINQVTYILF